MNTITQRLRMPVQAWTGLVAVLLFQAVFVGWIVVEPWGEVALTRFDDISLTLISCAATVACALSALRYRGTRHGTAWALVAGGLLFNTFGELAWGVQELAIPGEVPFPSVADIGYLGLYPLAFLGLLLMPQAPTSPSHRLRLGLDLLISMGALVLVSWRLILDPLLTEGGLSTAADAVSLIYPISDLALTLGAAILMLRAGRNLSTLTLLLLGLGFFSIAASDSLYAYLTQTGAYNSGSYIDIGWASGYNFITISAIVSASRGVNLDQASSGGRRPVTWLRTVAIHAPLIPLATLLVIDGVQGSTSVVLLTGFLSIACLTFIRQLMTISENRALNEQLEDLTAKLSVKVQDQRLTLQRKTDEMRQSEELFSKAFHAGPAALAITRVRDDTFINANDAFLRLSGFALDEVIGKSSADLRIWANAQEREQIGKLLAEKGTAAGISATFRAKSGRLVDTLVSATLVEVSGEQCVFTIGFDITEQRIAEETIKRLAYYDPLTQLPNRTLLQDRLNSALNDAQRDSRNLALLLIDFGNFNKINETLGHGTGDRALKQIAADLKRLTQKRQTLARVGGNVFSTLLEDAGAAEAEDFAANILKSLGPPRRIHGREFNFKISIGIATYPDQGEDAETLLRNADTALHRVKQERGGFHAVYSPGMRKNVVEQVELEAALRQALKEGQFVLYYQPQVNLRTGLISGVEVLSRWNHPEKGIITPVQFIPLAEEMGLIVEMDERVIRQAAVAHAAWTRLGLGVPIAVNLSALQFSGENFPQWIARLLSETKIAPANLRLEITEGTVVQDVERTVEILRQVRAMDVEIAVDDFGTGYSSLSYLKYLPVNTVKIDRAFVKGLPTDERDLTLTTAIVNMAHSLGLTVVAEGVETVDQRRVLQDIGCDEFQGYLFSQPVPEPQLLELLKSHNSRPRAVSLSGLSSTRLR